MTTFTQNFNYTRRVSNSRTKIRLFSLQPSLSNYTTIESIERISKFTYPKGSEYKLEQADYQNNKTLYLPGNIETCFKPNFFRNRLQTGYHRDLHSVLKDNTIVSCLIKIRFETEYIRCLATRFGYKFNFAEMKNWNFAKSPYFSILKTFYDKKQIILSQQLTTPSITANPIFLIEEFDYHFEQHKAPLNLDQLYTRFVGCLLDLDELYDPGKIDYFSITFTLLKNVNHNTPLKNINSIPLKKGFNNIRNIRKAFNANVLPLSLNENLYGKRVYSTRTYIDSEFKRVVTDLSENITKKEIFSIKTGELLHTFTDEKLNSNTFKRISKDSTITIKDDQIIKTSASIELKKIPKPYRKAIMNTFNKRIGSLDLETFVDSTGKVKVYAIGFCFGEGHNILISKPEIKTYYLDSNKTSDDIVLDCINQMLQTKYHQAIFYTHNLGGYDAIFILKILADFNEKVGYKYYSIKAILKDSRILQLQISAQISKTVKNKIYLVDSLSLLPTSLSSLSKGFSTKYEKPLFPYSFVNEKTLNYIGKTPDIEYFHSSKEEVKEDEYAKYKKEFWNLKEETLNYLESDLIGLLEIMYEFSKNVFGKYNIQVTECLTITSLAVKIFLTNYYSKKNPLGLLTTPHIYEDLKKAYYGGLSEVYRGYGENLYYYDVNSLYPHAALNDMPGHLCTWTECLSNDELLDLKNDNLFGFFYCKVKTPKDAYFGVLPVRYQGLLTYPLGVFEGWWFSPQIEYAISQGYDIKIIKGYNFNRVSNLFDNYVKDLYKEKKETVGAKRLIAKFLLNSLLGRFGLKLDQITTSLIDSTDYQDLITKHVIHDEKVITDNLYLVTHSKDISGVKCSQHGIDYIDVLSKESSSKYRKEYETVQNVSVGVSAAVTSYSAIFMLKIKQHILDLGGKIYYTDTDSIVTDIKLNEYEGLELGEFKLEYKILRGYFISSKLYCLIIWDEKNKKEKAVIKSKGVYSSKLTENDFKKLLNNEIITHGVKVNSKKNYTEGYVTITSKNDININPNNYKKRIKVIDSKTKRWIDTKPLVFYSET